MLAGCIEFSWRVIYRSAFKRRNHSLNSQLRQVTNYKELYLTTDTLQFFVDNASLWSGVQCFYKQFLLWLLLLNFIASQLVTVWLLIKYATFWSGKTMVYLNLVSVALALCSVNITLVLWWKWYRHSFRLSFNLAHYHRYPITDWKFFFPTGYLKSNQLLSAHFDPLPFEKWVYTKLLHTPSNIWKISG